MDGQCVYRTALVLGQARGGLPVGARECERVGGCLGKMAFRLQLLETPSGTWLQDAVGVLSSFSGLWDILRAVWVGNPDGKPMRSVSGVTGAAPALHAIFLRLHATYGTTWFARPQNIHAGFVHPLTGHAIAPSHPPDLPANAPCIPLFATQSKNVT